MSEGDVKNVPKTEDGSAGNRRAHPPVTRVLSLAITLLATVAAGAIFITHESALGKGKGPQKGRRDWCWTTLSERLCAVDPINSDHPTCR
jgi:hypothetical protein